jgi:hypothetical protein
MTAGRAFFCFLRRQAFSMPSSAFLPFMSHSLLALPPSPTVAEAASTSFFICSALFFADASMAGSPDIYSFILSVTS